MLVSPIVGDVVVHVLMFQSLLVDFENLYGFRKAGRWLTACRFKVKARKKLSLTRTEIKPGWPYFVYLLNKRAVPDFYKFKTGLEQVLWANKQACLNRINKYKNRESKIPKMSPNVLHWLKGLNEKHLAQWKSSGLICVLSAKMSPLKVFGIIGWAHILGLIIGVQKNRVAPNATIFSNSIFFVHLS